MSQKSRERHRQRKVAEAEILSRSEDQLEQQALRNHWIQGREFNRIADRLYKVIDREDVLGENDRYAMIAARTLIQAQQRQQALDFQEQKLAAEQYAAARSADGARTGTVSGDPVDPARYDWFATDCPCGLPVGECKEHPRARASQRPPDGDWTRWFLMAGRGSGKTRAGAEWVKERVESGAAKRFALVAPTAADVRDVMVEGESGILAVSRPDCMPVYQPSIRRLTWPNGAVATCFSADEPERLRGPQHDHAWIDEPGAWRRDQATWDNLMFGLRLGTRPQVCATSTPRATKLIKFLAHDPKTIISKCSTYENKTHLAPSFFSEIIDKYAGTRLGEQEIMAELLEITEGAWFATFNIARHVSESADYDPRFPIRVAIDAGTSRHTGAVLFQMRPRPTGWPKITVFADYHALDVMSLQNAEAIRNLCADYQQRGPDLVRLDPAADQKTSLGPVAYNEYARVFGDRIIGRWPYHGVADGLGQVELLLGAEPAEPRMTIHPRCKHLIPALQNYRREERNGEYLDTPVDPQHPHEDLVDALRGGVRDAMPEGNKAPPALRQVHAGRIN